MTWGYLTDALILASFTRLIWADLPVVDDLRVELNLDDLTTLETKAARQLQANLRVETAKRTRWSMWDPTTRPSRRPVYPWLTATMSPGCKCADRWESNLTLLWSKEKKVKTNVDGVISGRHDEVEEVRKI